MVFVQDNQSMSVKGVLRGLHFQKQFPQGKLVRAVRDVARGRRYLGTNIAQYMALAAVDGEGSPFDQLSPRELEVAMLLVRGLRQEDIAKRLSLSAKTINTHKSRLFEKLDIKDNIALARLAGQYGLTDTARSV